ncbi:MAG: sigma-E factor regulatory protein RseB, partial [Vibrio sp.]
MKKILISTLLLFSWMTQAASADDVSAEALLRQMNEASHNLNYELSYILVQKNSIEPLVYRHANVNEQHIAHLAYLSGPLREVIQRDSEVSYIEPNTDPFTIQSNHMVAPLLPFIDSDIDKLSQLYDFLLIGRSREAGAVCQVIRVVPKDGLRYSYLVWIDERSKLPLRADLKERNGETLEQYRTISFSINDQIGTLLERLNDAQLPKVLSVPKTKPQTPSWRVTWLPDGFKGSGMNRYRISATQNMVESQVYTDGLFHFSIYVSDIDDSENKAKI